jgi:hypothetical protein
MAGGAGAGQVSAVPPEAGFKVYNRRVCTPVSLAVIRPATGTAGSMTVGAGNADNSSMCGMTPRNVRINCTGGLAGTVCTCSAMTTAATAAGISGVSLEMTRAAIGRQARGWVECGSIDIGMTAGNC